MKELEVAGVIRRKSLRSEVGASAYSLTAAGRELAPLVEAFGVWGQRWVESELSLQNLDVTLLMWDMRRGLNTTPMPTKRSVIQFQYPELAAARRYWWLIVAPDHDVDLCSVDPGFDVDLYVSTDLRTMTEVWMGFETTRRAQATKRMILTGDEKLAADIQTWLGLSPFARAHKLAS